MAVEEREKKAIKVRDRSHNQDYSRSSSLRTQTDFRLLDLVSVRYLFSFSVDSRQIFSSLREQVWQSGDNVSLQHHVL